MHESNNAGAETVERLISERRFETVFQPILAADGSTIHGYEALCRLPPGSSYPGPVELFAAAQETGQACALDLLLVELAIERFARLGLDGKLFLNVLPKTVLCCDGLHRLLARVAEQSHGGHPRCADLVIEITEHGLDLDPACLQARVQALRSLGCQVAIDDLGAGASGLKAWSILRPDYVKLDRYFIASLQDDAVGIEVVRSLLDIAHVMGSCLVAEGIETQDQCRVLRDLGVDYLQGYYLGRPERAPLRGAPAADLSVRDSARNEDCADALLIERAPLTPQTRVVDVVTLFQNHPDWDSLAVVADGRAVGVVRRDQLLTLLSKPLHPEIYNRKPIAAVMDARPTVVDARARLDQISRLVTAGQRSRINEDFLIARHGLYAGLGRTIALLQMITTSQVAAAAQSNPLTLLPGNREIDAQLQRMLALRVPFIVGHADIDNFKAYNDAYGYRAGDQVLLHVADQLKSVCSASTDFVGHVGGDDFIVILRSQDWISRLNRLFDVFSASIDNYYEEPHRQRGELPGVDRDGKPRLFPLMTLSIGAASCWPGRYANPAEIGDALRKAKNCAKAHRGHAWFHDEHGEPREMSPISSSGRSLALPAQTHTRRDHL
jgi:EAL domain-containing protein (putative c-di-GMP-specific phosphodiesterase class I)/GGDEF domain-containing protein